MPGVHGVQSIYFDARHMPRSTEVYVAWADLLGMQSLLQRSLVAGANAVFKFHAAALEECRRGVYLYPVMDGLYAVAVERDELLSFLSRLFSRVAAHFLDRPENDHRFIPKGGIAHGEVVHGRDVQDAASLVYRDFPDYRSALLVGAPVVRAFLCEKTAPPFGVAVDPTAMTILSPQQKKLSHLWWPWYTDVPAPLTVDLIAQLEVYFDWCSRRSGAIDYDASKIKEHRRVALEYFKYTSCVGDDNAHERGEADGTRSGP